MKKVKVLTLIIILLLSVGCAMATQPFPDQIKSFAEEYKTLRLLLEEVTNTDTALAQKSAIENEILRLKQTQSSGSEIFHSLSDADKKLFVKRFQQNRLHCSEVTQVMHETRRILLNPKLSEILADTLTHIP